MVGTIGAVDTRRAAKLGRQRDHRFAPSHAHVGFNLGERLVQRPEQLRQPALRDAFIEMGVPAIERERADARAIRLR